jgi:hypothetical protein
MTPQIRERNGMWYIEGYDDLGFWSKSNAEQYYLTYLANQEEHRRFWRWKR